MRLFFGVWFVGGAVAAALGACDSTPEKEERGSGGSSNDWMDLDLDDEGSFIGDGSASGGTAGAPTCEDPIGGAAGFGGAGGNNRAGGALLPLQLPGCPAQEPVVSDCEGPARSVTCLYPVEQGCYHAWLCELGIWSPQTTSCARKLLAPEQDPACPELAPVETTPCSEELTCGYAHCGYVKHIEIEASCVCGRWQVKHGGCPTVP